jgi:hypothetical protein
MTRKQEKVPRVGHFLKKKEIGFSKVVPPEVCGDDGYFNQTATTDVIICY